MTLYTADPTFCKVVALVIKSEGNYVNDPRDKGGPTKYGVAWNYNADYLRTHCGMRNPTDVQHLTLEQARQLYYDKYWWASGGSGISSVALAYIHFDTAVNCGVGGAQHILTALGGNPRSMDGRNGANLGYFRGLLLLYVSHRLRYYTHDCSKEQQAHYLPGWDNRLADVIENALALN